MRIFLDVVAFVDYPEVIHCLDVIVPPGSSPCHLCSFRRMKNGARIKFAYTTEVHCQDSSFMRTAERTQAMGLSDLSNVEYNKLGMKHMISEECERGPSTHSMWHSRNLPHHRVSSRPQLENRL